MFRNYLRVTLRNIFKHKGYSFINIAGLAIGMACCLLIAIWVLDELSYDKFHEKAFSLYRVEENQHYSGREYHVNVTPYPLAPALKEEIPEIADAARYVWAGGLLFRYNDEVHFESAGRAVDPSFLNMFSFPFVNGNEKTALDSPYSLIISEEMAKKYFPDEHPVGKVINVNNTHDFTVTGVIQDVPHNSFLQFDFLVPYEFLVKTGQTQDKFDTNSIQTFVQLQESITMDQVNPKILGFIRTKVPESLTDLVLMPYSRIHLHGYFGYDRTMGSIQYVYIFSIIAAFVLIIACINFMNLATARSASRAKEVGMRKVVGALRQHIIRQFYGESVFYALISLVFAVALVSLLLPGFSSLAEKELSWSVSGIEAILLGLIGITLFTGIVAGSYPALFLSAFQPVKVLRGTLKSGRGATRFRRVLVVFQFILSVCLIVGTTVVYRQLNFMQGKKLGWDKEHVLYIPLRADIKKSYSALKSELLKDSRVVGVTGTWQRPSYLGSNSSGVDWDGKDPNMRVLIGINSVDFDFIETLKIEMVEGRSFSEDYASDHSQAFIVNQEVAKLMDKESVVGERFKFVGIEGIIVGVMKNFHFQPVREKIEPLAIIVDLKYVNYMLIRIPAGDIPASLDYIEETWNEVIPDYPFSYYFMDEDFDSMYRAEEKVGILLKYFAIIAVLVACLGLFGLASFTAEQRTKEIGIRKVLGASLSQITALLCKEFFFLVLLANIIAWPLAYFVMNMWLDNYAYRADLGLTVFISAMVLAVVVAVISVSFQAVRAALGNPVDALKYE